MGEGEHNPGQPPRENRKDEASSQPSQSQGTSDTSKTAPGPKPRKGRKEEDKWGRVQRVLLGLGIRLERQKLGISQQQMAESLGVDVPALSEWETGDQVPPPELLARICELFNTTVEKLLIRAVEHQRRERERERQGEPERTAEKEREQPREKAHEALPVRTPSPSPEPDKPPEEPKPLRREVGESFPLKFLGRKEEDLAPYDVLVIKLWALRASLVAASASLPPYLVSLSPHQSTVPFFPTSEGIPSKEVVQGQAALLRDKLGIALFSHDIMAFQVALESALGASAFVFSMPFQGDIEGAAVRYRDLSLILVSSRYSFFDQKVIALRGVSHLLFDLSADESAYIMAPLASTRRLAAELFAGYVLLPEKALAPLEMALLKEESLARRVQDIQRTLGAPARFILHVIQSRSNAISEERVKEAEKELPPLPPGEKQVCISPAFRTLLDAALAMGKITTHEAKNYLNLP